MKNIHMAIIVLALLLSFTGCTKETKTPAADADCLSLNSPQTETLKSRSFRAFTTFFSGQITITDIMLRTKLFQAWREASGVWNTYQTIPTWVH